MTGDGLVLSCALVREKCVTLVLDHLDLLHNQFQPVQLTGNLGFHMLCQHMTVTCLQFPEALASIFLKGLVIADTLREKKPLYPIDVTDTFHHQRFLLPADPPPVFLFMGNGPHHRTYARFLPLEGQQNTQQRLAIDTISLHAQPAARRSD